MIRAVIVDFDDTLCLTEEACFNLENEVLRRMGRPPGTREVHKATWGQHLFEVISIRSPGVDVPTFRKILLEAQLEWVEDGRIDAVTPENLRALDELLAARVKAFYYRDVMSHHKPDPRAFDNLLK